MIRSEPREPGKLAEEDVTPGIRAWAIYHFLVSAAHNHKLVTYNELKTATGIPGAQRNFGAYLNRIHDYCVSHGLPSLAVLVVNATKGEPGQGIYEGGRLTREEIGPERMRAHQFRWYRLVPPGPEEL